MRSGNGTDILAPDLATGDYDNRPSHATHEVGSEIVANCDPAA